MNLNTNTIKNIIQHTIPVDMEYIKAQPTRDRDGRIALRTMGISKDKYFTVELIGHPKRLTKLVFMSLYEPTLLGRNLKAVNKIIAKEVPHWKEDWLVEKMPILEDNKDVSNGRVRVKRIHLESDISAVFIELQ